MKKTSLTIIPLILILILAGNVFSGNVAGKLSQNPSDVLEKAREYVRVKEYSAALKNYIWFFRYSTDIDKSFWAVKLSYCLNEWRDLGNVYEPALKEFRKELAIRKERLENGEADVWLFLEFNAFCISDGKGKDAIDMFMNFHNGKNKEFAKAIFPLIQHKIGDLGFYGICNEYIKDPMQSFQEIKPLYDLDRDSFNKEIFFLLSVLKKNDRNIEYQQLKTKVIELNPSDEFKDRLNKLEN